MGLYLILVDYEESPSELQGFIMNQESISTIDFPGSMTLVDDLEKESWRQEMRSAPT